MVEKSECTFPGDNLDPHKMPGHWLLSQMGKRVLRPGGLVLTDSMLTHLNIQTTDDVLEFAPGLGVTAKRTLQYHPTSYTAIERDNAAALQVRQYLDGIKQTCKVGSAEHTGLANNSFSVVYGEAMLTMQLPAIKSAIIQEAARLLVPRGRYGIHELCLCPDDISEEKKEEISKDLSQAIHVGARPLTVSEWQTLLETNGFQVNHTKTSAMHLLEPARIFQDEGLFGGLRFLWNVIRTPVARQRILNMRAVFRKHSDYLGAIEIVSEKKN